WKEQSHRPIDRKLGTAGAILMNLDTNVPHYPTGRAVDVKKP
ncbi:hypothetical protein AVEN_125069-1, partial [Araneus ventricosus]